MPSYKLTYFNIRDRGETARIIMEYGGIEYEDNRIPYPDVLPYQTEQWVKLKPTTPFGKIPVLEVDGVQICQSHAINRFLAKKIGLHGRSDIEEAKIDMAVGCMEDIISALSGIFGEKDQTKKAEMRNSRQEALTEGLRKFEKLIEGDYILGNQMSWADIFVLGQIGYITALGMDVSLDNLPMLARLLDKVKAQPKIAAWIAKRPQTPI